VKNFSKYSRSVYSPLYPDAAVVKSAFNKGSETRLRRHLKVIVMGPNVIGWTVMFISGSQDKLALGDQVRVANWVDTRLP